MASEVFGQIYAWHQRKRTRFLNAGVIRHFAQTLRLGCGSYGSGFVDGSQVMNATPELAAETLTDQPLRARLAAIFAASRALYAVSY